MGYKGGAPQTGCGRIRSRAAGGHGAVPRRRGAGTGGTAPRTPPRSLPRAEEPARSCAHRGTALRPQQLGRAAPAGQQATGGCSLGRGEPTRSSQAGGVGAKEAAPSRPVPSRTHYSSVPAPRRGGPALLPPSASRRVLAAASRMRRPRFQGRRPQAPEGTGLPSALSDWPRLVPLSAPAAAHPSPPAARAGRLRARRLRGPAEGPGQAQPGQPLRRWIASAALEAPEPGPAGGRDCWYVAPVASRLRRGAAPLAEPLPPCVRLVRARYL